MQWPGYFPDDCPPQDAQLATGDVYRLVKQNPPESKDFVPLREKKTSEDFGEKECQACGLSVECFPCCSNSTGGLMMGYLPQSTHLGKLELIEVYEFYDQPILFSCRNASDAIFIGVFADEDDNFETWLYVGVSPHRFKQIRSGAIDLHDAFSEVEDGIIFQIKMPHNEQIPESMPISATQIPDDMLPLPGEFIDLETPTLPELDEDIERKSLQKQFKEFSELERHVTGTLIGVFTDTRTFGLEAQDGTIYKGKILDEAFNTASSATISEKYIATIREVASIQPVTKEMNTDYYLVKLESV